VLFRGFARLERLAHGSAAAARRVLELGLEMLANADDDRRLVAVALADLVADVEGEAAAEEMRTKLGLSPGASEMAGRRRLGLMERSDLDDPKKFMEKLRFGGLRASDTLASTTQVVDIEQEEEHEVVDLDGEVVYLDGASSDKTGVIMKKPNIAKLLPFKPEEEAILPASAVFSDEYLADVPLSLKSLLTLLPPKELMVGGAANLGNATAVDTVLKVLRVAENVKVNINNFREIHEDGNLLRLRGRSAAGALGAAAVAGVGRAVAPLSTLKRLDLGGTNTTEEVADEDVDVRIKRSVEEINEKEYKDVFFQHLKENLHRDRIMYKRSRFLVAKAMDEDRWVG
jgi:hypothetical protein